VFRKYKRKELEGMVLCPGFSKQGTVAVFVSWREGGIRKGCSTRKQQIGTAEGKGRTYKVGKKQYLKRPAVLGGEKLQREGWTVIAHSKGDTRVQDDSKVKRKEGVTCYLADCGKKLKSTWVI